MQWVTGKVIHVDLIQYIYINILPTFNNTEFPPPLPLRRTMFVITNKLKKNVNFVSVYVALQTI